MLVNSQFCFLCSVNLIDVSIEDPLRLSPPPEREIFSPENVRIYVYISGPHISQECLQTLYGLYGLGPPHSKFMPCNQEREGMKQKYLSFSFMLHYTYCLPHHPFTFHFTSHHLPHSISSPSALHALTFRSPCSHLPLSMHSSSALHALTFCAPFPHLPFSMHSSCALRVLTFRSPCTHLLLSISSPSVPLPLTFGSPTPYGPLSITSPFALHPLTFPLHLLTFRSLSFLHLLFTFSSPPLPYSLHLFHIVFS